MQICDDVEGGDIFGVLVTLLGCQRSFGILLGQLINPLLRFVIGAKLHDLPGDVDRKRPTNGTQYAIKKASYKARNNMFQFTMVNNSIPHEATGVFGAGKVWMKPAAPGTGVIAGGGVRNVLEAGGIKNILTKSLGSNNHFSMVYATLEALKMLKSKEEIKKLRGRG